MRLEWPKVKNIIILILAIVDAFLLFLVLGRQRAVDRYAQSAITGAVEVLAQNGVAVSPGALDNCDALPALTTSRDLSAESAVTQALLGPDTTRRDQSGGLYAYESPIGTALFRATGDFEAYLTQRPAASRTPAEHALALLADMGLTGELAGSPQGPDGEVVLYQTVNGAPVYSCQLVFRYEEGALASVSGTMLTGTLLPAAEDPKPLDLPSALMRLLSGVLERGGVCSVVTDLRPGYRLEQSFGTEMHLAPTWLAVTNTGNYYLDSITGTLTSAET